MAGPLTPGLLSHRIPGSPIHLPAIKRGMFYSAIKEFLSRYKAGRMSAGKGPSPGLTAWGRLRFARKPSWEQGLELAVQGPSPPARRCFPCAQPGLHGRQCRLALTLVTRCPDCSVFLMVTLITASSLSLFIRVLTPQWGFTAVIRFSCHQQPSEERSMILDYL